MMTAFQAGLILMRMEDYPHAGELSGTDVIVVATLFSFAADKHPPVAYPSVAKVAARSRLGTRTVARSLKHLEKVGVITGEHRHRRATRWSLDPSLTKGGGGDPRSSGTATGAGSTVTGADVDGQRGSQHRSEGQSTSVTGADQCTEVSSGTKWRNSTDVRSGSASGKSARSARRTPSGSPPPDSKAATSGTTKTKPARSGTAKTKPAPRKPGPRPCLHGVANGMRPTSNRRGEFTCRKCTALAPNPDTEKYRQWLNRTPGLERQLINTGLTCSNPENERAADELARRTLDAHNLPPQPNVLLRFKAYIVSQLEPGRIDKLLATTSKET